MSIPTTQQPVRTAENSVKDGPISDAQIAARNKRIAVLNRIAGIWADRKDIPSNSVDHQRQLRAEWR